MLKEEGCIAVEMELAGVQALCDFYGLTLYDFLEAGDVLSDSSYDINGLHAANHDLIKDSAIVSYIGIYFRLRR